MQHLSKYKDEGRRVGLPVPAWPDSVWLPHWGPAKGRSSLPRLALHGLILSRGLRMAECLLSDRALNFSLPCGPDCVSICCSWPWFMLPFSGAKRLQWTPLIGQRWPLPCSPIRSPACYNFHQWDCRLSTRSRWMATAHPFQQSSMQPVLTLRVFLSQVSLTRFPLQPSVLAQRAVQPVLCILWIWRPTPDGREISRIWERLPSKLLLWGGNRQLMQAVASQAERLHLLPQN